MLQEALPSLSLAVYVVEAMLYCTPRPCLPPPPQGQRGAAGSSEARSLTSWFPHHQGNIKFVEPEEGSLEQRGLAVTDEVLVDHVAELTATPREMVLRCLLARTVASGGRELIEKGHTAAEASYARDACAKVLWRWGGNLEAFPEETRPEAVRGSWLLGSSQAVYQRLFEWVVDRINRVMEPRDRDPRRDGKDTVIGVLDIYGFEVFPVNRWVALPPHPDPAHPLRPP